MEWCGKHIGAGAIARKGYLSLSWNFLAPGRSANSSTAGQFWAGKFTAGTPGVPVWSYDVPEISVCFRREGTHVICVLMVTFRVKTERVKTVWILMLMGTNFLTDLGIVSSLDTTNLKKKCILKQCDAWSNDKCLLKTCLKDINP